MTNPVTLQDSLSALKTLLKNNLTNRGLSVDNINNLTTLSNKVLDINSTVPTSVTLISNKNLININTDPIASLTVTAKDYGNNPLKNNDIKILSGSNVIYTGQTNNSGILNYDYRPTEPSVTNLTAQIVATGNYETSTSSEVPITVVSILNTTTTLYANKTSLSILSNKQSTLTAHVVDSSGAAAKNVSVQFKNGNSILDTKVTNDSGDAVYTYTTSSVGSVSIVAHTVANSSYQESTSSGVTITTYKESSSSSINIASLSSNYIGATVVLTGSNSGGGTVYYYEGNTLLGTSSSGGNISVGGLSEGTHTYHTYFAGDGNYNGSDSGTVSVGISKYDSGLSVSSTGGTIYIGYTSVTVSASGAGTVYIKSGSTTLASGSGSTSYTFTPSSSSTSFNVSCSGDGSHYGGSTTYTVSATSRTTPTLSLVINSSTQNTYTYNTLVATRNTSGTTLRLYVNDSEVASSTGTGVSYQLYPTSEGTYRVYAKSDGSDAYVEVQTGTQTVTASNKTSSLTASTGASSTYYGWYVYYVLKTNDGTAITDASPSATYNGTTVGMQNMGSGVYRFQHYVGADGGTLNVSVSYGGKSGVNGCSISNSIPINSLPSSTTEIATPVSVSTEGSGGNYSSWSNLSTGNTTSNYASCQLTYTHNNGGSTDLPPTIVANYNFGLSNVYKVTNAEFGFRTRLVNKSSSSSPSMAAPAGRMWINGTKVIDTYGNANSLGNWVLSQLSAACNVNYGNVVTRLIFNNNTGYGSGEMDEGALMTRITYRYIPSQ